MPEAGSSKPISGELGGGVEASVTGPQSPSGSWATTTGTDNVPAAGTCGFSLGAPVKSCPGSEGPAERERNSMVRSGPWVMGPPRAEYRWFVQWIGPTFHGREASARPQCPAFPAKAPDMWPEPSSCTISGAHTWWGWGLHPVAPCPICKPFQQLPPGWRLGPRGRGCAGWQMGLQGTGQGARPPMHSAARRAQAGFEG